MIRGISLFFFTPVQNVVQIDQIDTTESCTRSASDELVETIVVLCTGYPGLKESDTSRGEVVRNANRGIIANRLDFDALEVVCLTGQAT